MKALEKGFRLFSFGFGKSEELPLGLYVYESAFRGLSLNRLRQMFAQAVDMRTRLGGRQDLLPRDEAGRLEFGEAAVFAAPWGVCVQNGRLSGVTWDEAFQHLSLAEIQELLRRAVEPGQVDMKRLVKPAGRGVYHPLDAASLRVEQALGGKATA